MLSSPALSAAAHAACGMPPGPLPPCEPSVASNCCVIHAAVGVCRPALEEGLFVQPRHCGLAMRPSGQRTGAAFSTVACILLIVGSATYLGVCQRGELELQWWWFSQGKVARVAGLVK